LGSQFLLSIPIGIPILAIPILATPILAIPILAIPILVMTTDIFKKKSAKNARLRHFAKCSCLPQKAQFGWLRLW
jgi:hypothetical protein